MDGTIIHDVYPPPETNGLPLKMDGWNTIFLIGTAYFQGLCWFQGYLKKEDMTWFRKKCLQVSKPGKMFEASCCFSGGKTCETTTGEFY